jgi:hypothetical protein
MDGACSTHVYNIWIAKPEGRRRLGNPRRTFTDNIKINLKVIQWKGVGWIHLV